MNILFNINGCLKSLFYEMQEGNKNVAYGSLKRKELSRVLFRSSVIQALSEKYPNTEFFLVRIFPYSVRMWENTDQTKLRIWTFFLLKMLVTTTIFLLKMLVTTTIFF